jgi:hypothetical protein
MIEDMKNKTMRDPEKPVSDILFDLEKDNQV